MKKIIILLLLILILNFVFCSCAKKIESGEVYKKEYRPARSSLIYLPQTVVMGNNVTTMSVPKVVYYPERYVVFIRAYHEGEWISEDFYVSPERYAQIQLGDNFTYNEELGDLNDEPYTEKEENNVQP